MAAVISTETDWYTTKQRVDFYLQKANINGTTVDNFIMDDAYEWVNGRLSTKGFDSTDPIVAADLKLSPLLRQAQTWYACFLTIRTINANLNQAAVVPDGHITSQAVGQGDHSIGYETAKDADDEKPTPDYNHMAQRSMNEFFANVADQFAIPPQSIMAVSNAYRREPYWTAADDHANKLRKMYYRRRR